jgi:hypothetical protein
VSVPLIVCLIVVAIPVGLVIWVNQALLVTFAMAVTVITSLVAVVATVLLTQNAASAVPATNFLNAFKLVGDVVGMLVTILVAIWVCSVAWSSPSGMIARFRARRQGALLREKYLMDDLERQAKELGLEYWADQPSMSRYDFE